MIEPHAPVKPAAPQSPAEPCRAPLPVAAGTARLLVLVGVFVCAACGLVYELELVALASYLMGDSVTQASVVLSVMVFAMGLGSLAAKRLRARAAAGFGMVEAALALVGGCSAMALYAAFVWTGDWGGAWTDGPRYLLVGFSLAIGVLIGAEVPLLMVLIQRIRRQDPGGAVADLFAADYVGALVGGLAFPFLLLPRLGQLTGALLTGGVNAVAGGALVLGLFRRDLCRRCRWLLLVANVTAIGLLATAWAHVGDFERAARHAMFGAHVRVAQRTGTHEVVLTQGRGGTVDLYLDGRLRVRGADEPRYHRSLVGPAMDGGPHARVLVLGGGDGLAVHEVLRHPGVRHVDVVDPDPGLVRLARRDPGLAELNGRSLSDPRVHVTTGDVFRRVREAAPSRPYDVVVCDLPDPVRTDSAKLYSQEFYGLVGRVLGERGRVVVHTGRSALPTVAATLRSAGLRVVAYRGAGNARYALAGWRRPVAPPGARLPEPAPGRAPSTLVHPRYGEQAP
ncbi:polyamine aminopropyltransferase [Streptomyces beihaiensis]|uniref:Polyamine aminopropyltransferase n=1 Tax=Streptomyces beihaiensis TaxID=2984495 RepID=A0ABT3TXQ9_9ACTN|nr:polyamine aminopropyltransferase [Streptomyces beihaiensis]MCX3060748.1 polyamine aminopropyltransferase [Streptomyces beihaiensis]